MDSFRFATCALLTSESNLSLVFTMNRTEAPSRPLLPRDEGDTNVLDDDTQSASHSPRPSTPLAKPKNVSESTAVKKTRLAAFFASVAAVFVAVPRYFTTGCKRCGHAFAGIARRRWTSETFSLLFASLSLLGLVATLVAHQGKPLPQWPQLITINSIISLFSILIRAGVSVVLAEGTFITRCDTSGSLTIPRHKPIQVAVVSGRAQAP